MSPELCAGITAFLSRASRSRQKRPSAQNRLLCPNRETGQVERAMRPALSQNNVRAASRLSAPLLLIAVAFRNTAYAHSDLSARVNPRHRLQIQLSRYLPLKAVCPNPASCNLTLSEHSISPQSEEVL
jgi:hypothetical protein